MILKYEFIRSEEGNYSVRSMCRWAQVSRSGYQDWRERPVSARAARRAELTAMVEFVYDESEQTYGYRRVAAELARMGQHVDPQTVRSIMAEHGWVGVAPRRRGPRTTVAGDAADVPDHFDRDFTATEAGAKLVGDITYIPTWAGWVYLATVLDCFSKKVVGYAMATHMRTSLVTDALGMAHRNGHIRPGLTTFHSDRGTQYHTIYVGRVQRIHRQHRRNPVGRSHRHLLRQRLGRVVQRDTKG